MAVFAQGIAAMAVEAEVHWAPFNGTLAAISIDPESWASQVVMQGMGSARTYVYSATTQPGTGVLWIGYYDFTAGEDRLGIWPVGAADPTGVASFPDKGLVSLAFSPTGALYGTFLDFAAGAYVLGTIDLTSGEVTDIVVHSFDAGTLEGVAVHPVTGTLYFAGRDCIGDNCRAFIDTLTIPAHVRARAWGGGQGIAYLGTDPLFDSTGDLVFSGYHLANGYGFYRPTVDGAVKIAPLPKVLGPFGPSEFWAFDTSPAAVAGGCIPSPTSGCLQGRRFRVEATYDATVLGGSAGTARPNLESDQSIKFSFFEPKNLELFAKIIDGCSYNGHFWVFASGLTNAGVSLRITDLVTAAVYSYDSPAGQAFVPQLDIEALACN